MKAKKQYTTVVLVVSLVVAVAYIYHQNKQYRDAIVDNQRLSLALDDKTARLLEAEKAIAALEKKTVEGMMEETNKVVVSGWETLLNTVRNELNKAKERFNEEATKTLDNNSTSTNKPPVQPATPTPLVEGERT